MAKHKMDKLQKHKHERAFEIYSDTDANGNRRSNNAVAQMVGASASAVAYWKRRDNWDGKLLASIDDEIKNADLTNRNIKRLLRESLFNHIKSLNRVIEFSRNDDAKVTAIKAFVHIAKELSCLEPDTGLDQIPAQPPAFEDDLPHGPAEQASEGPAGTDPPADGAGSPVGGPDPVESPVDLSTSTGTDPVLPAPADDSHLESAFKSVGV